MNIIINIILAIIVGVYFIVTMAIGLAIQCKAAQQSKEAFGNFPIWSCVSHCIIGVCLTVTAAFPNIVSAIIAGVFWLIKLACLGCSQECSAFQNARNAQQTDQFLQYLRTICPRAFFRIECWHNETVHYRDSDGHMRTRTEKRVTYRETRHVQITGFYDTTPPLYIKIMKPIIYLQLGHSIQWLGTSSRILDELRRLAYVQNQWRDRNIDISFQTTVDGLTKDNYLKNGEFPPCMNRGYMFLSCFFCYDPLYLCILRSSVPETFLSLKKNVTLEPQGLAMQHLTSPVSNVDKVELPPIDYEQLMKPTVDAISLPPILQENTQPYVTDIKPPGFDFDRNVTAINPPIQETVMFESTVTPGQNGQPVVPAQVM